MHNRHVAVEPKDSTGPGWAKAKKGKQGDIQKPSDFQAPFHVSATAVAEGLGSPLTS